jgi:chromate transporter
MSHEHFLDLIGATNLIPGPNSTEMALHCGQERAGWRGLLVAGACFILPAVFITGIFAWLYQRYGAAPQLQPYLYGIKPAIIGVIVALMIVLGKKAVKSWELAAIGLVTLGLAFAGVNEAVILFGMGAAGMLAYTAKKRFSRANLVLIPFLQGILLPGNKNADWKIFWIFLKVGSILYGSGYILFSFLNGELVKKGLLTTQTLTDAIAVGQFTPGPVFSSATFIGWQMNGISGALYATAGIFMPSFVFVGLLNPLVSRLRKSKVASAFLDAVNVAAIALIMTVCYDLGDTAIRNWKTCLIAAFGLIVSLMFKRVNSAFIIIGGAVAGYLLSLI